MGIDGHKTRRKRRDEEKQKQKRKKEEKRPFFLIFHSSSHSSHHHHHHRTAHRTSTHQPLLLLLVLLVMSMLPSMMLSMPPMRMHLLHPHPKHPQIITDTPSSSSPSRNAHPIFHPTHTRTMRMKFISRTTRPAPAHHTPTSFPATPRKSTMRWFLRYSRIRRR